MASLWQVKTKRLCSLWIKRTGKELLSPLLDPWGLVEPLTVFFAIYLAYLTSGLIAMKAEFLTVWAAQQALIAVIPVYVILCAFRAWFHIAKKEREKGQWHGASFYYHEDQLVFTVVVSADDNDKMHKFKVSDAETDSLVHLSVVINRADGRVLAQITGGAYGGVFPVAWESSSPLLLPRVLVGLRLPKNKTLSLLTHADRDAEPTKVRVYCSYWKVINKRE